MKKICTLIMFFVCISMSAQTLEGDVNKDGKKWATCNVGASSPEEYGDFFAWGETTH